MPQEKPKQKAEQEPKANPEEALRDKIEGLRPSGTPVMDTLETSDRVLARVTDGIYRQPSSALRELISNAYDADATEVVIDTDAPRFAKISIRDDGIGFSAEALAHMIKSIGGSFKRTRSGVEPNVVNTHDANLSPGGRRLIGKIGIGLFSVSQLTKHFQVITKERGKNYRTVADVVLKTHSEDDLVNVDERKRPVFETGDVQISKVPARDYDAHGTEVVLLEVLDRIKRDLRSTDLWEQVRRSRTDTLAAKPIEPPPYHIGHVDLKTGDTLEETAVLPWLKTEKSPVKRFTAMVDAMGREAAKTRKPNIRNTFDNYLQMLWTLSLCAPLDYVDKHPFDLTGRDGLRVFLLSNNAKDGAKEITLGANESVRSKLDLISPVRGSNSMFSVIIDGVALRRPLRFKDLPRSSGGPQQPLLFVGKVNEDFSKLPQETRGGKSLAFEAYLLWSPKVVPTDHTGVQIRISDSSGAAFDNTYMNYQVAELRRREQVSAEVFVLDGLDPALNIDRESFNFAHPHYYLLKRWFHNAFKQLATRHKEIGTKERDARKEKANASVIRAFEKLVSVELAKAGLEEQDGPEVELIDGVGENIDLSKRRQEEDILVFDKKKVIPPSALSGPKAEAGGLLLRKVKAIAEVLSAFGALDELDYEQQESLLRVLVAISSFEEEK